MSETQATLVMIALFALRCVAPLAITMGLCYLMNRLVDRWQAEEVEARRAEPIPVPMAQPAPAGFSLSEALADLSVPCWMIRNCPERKRDDCAAHEARGIPCWKARLLAEGALPEPCPDCPRYAASQALA